MNTTTSARIKAGRARADYPTLPATTAAYLAGFFDGEGTVSIQNIRRGRYWMVHLTLPSSSEDGFLRRLYEECTSVGSFHTETAPRAGSRPKQQWRMSGRAAIWFLRSVRPYLRLKRHQSEIVLAFCEDLQQRRCRLTPRDHAERKLLQLSLEYDHLNSCAGNASRWATPGSRSSQRATRIATDVTRVLHWQMLDEEDRHAFRAVWRDLEIPFPFYEASA